MEIARRGHRSSLSTDAFNRFAFILVTAVTFITTANILSAILRNSAISSVSPTMRDVDENIKSNLAGARAWAGKEAYEAEVDK
jgi:hypothetical protein